jgi:hypothetical protein
MHSQHRLIGAWHGEIQVNQSEQTKLLNDQQISELKAMTIDIDFQTDGSMKLSGTSFGKPYSSNGQWELLNENGNEVTIKSTESEDSTKEITVLFEGDNSFSMPLPGPLSRLGAMQFKRVLR